MADYAAEEMARQGYTAAAVATLAGVDEGTVRSFVNGERWPWASKRAAIERVLGLKTGTFELVARGISERPARPEPEGDSVEVAIRQSDLTRANQHKLIGAYYEMLDEQGREVRGA